MSLLMFIHLFMKRKKLPVCEFKYYCQYFCNLGNDCVQNTNVHILVTLN